MAKELILGSVFYIQNIQSLCLRRDHPGHRRLCRGLGLVGLAINDSIVMLSALWEHPLAR